MEPTSLSFFTPVDYGDQPKSFTQSILESVDHYFYLGGRKAQVIPGMQNGKQLVELVDGSQTLFKTCLKVASYFTLVLPLILGAVKLVLRALNSYEIVGKKAEEKPKTETNEESSTEKPTSSSSSSKSSSTDTTGKSKKASSGPKPPEGPAKEITFVSVAELRSGLSAFIQSIPVHEAALIADEVQIPEYYAAAKEKLDKTTEQVELNNPLQEPINEANLEGWATVTGDALEAFRALVYQRDEWRKKIDNPELWTATDQIYYSLAEAYYKLGNREKGLQCAAKIVHEIGSSFYEKIAEDYYKKGDKEQAIQTVNSSKYGKNPAPILAKIASDYIQAGEIAKAQGILANNNYSSELQNEIYALVLKEKRQLNWENPSATLQTILELNCIVAIPNLLLALLTEDYYNKGELVKALTTIAHIQPTAGSYGLDLTKAFLNKILEKKKPLARTTKDELLIGDRTQAIMTIVIATTSNVLNEKQRYLEQIRDFFYYLLAEDDYQREDYILAFQTLDKINRIEPPLIPQFMARVFDEKKLFKRNAQGEQSATRKAYEVATRKPYFVHTQISQTFFSQLAEDIYSDGDTIKAWRALNAGRYDDLNKFVVPFLTKALDENRPFEIPSEKDLQSVRTGSTDEADDALWALLAENHLRKGDKEKAGEAANKIEQNSERKARILKKIATERSSGKQ
jgi:hypothetical protein